MSKRKMILQPPGHHSFTRTTMISGKTFYESWIAKFPRRSGEGVWAQFMECKFLESRDFPRHMSFQELYDWLKPPVEAESKNSELQH